MDQPPALHLADRSASQCRNDLAVDAGIAARVVPARRAELILALDFADIARIAPPSVVWIGLDLAILVATGIGNLLEQQHPLAEGVPLGGLQQRIDVTRYQRTVCTPGRHAVATDD